MPVKRGGGEERIMKYQYKLRQDGSYSGWWAVVKGPGGADEHDFNAEAWFRHREDAEMWKLEKEEDRKRG
jgi:hypothetical protein